MQGGRPGAPQIQAQPPWTLTGTPGPAAPGSRTIGYDSGGDSFIHFEVLIKHLLCAYSSRRGQTRNWTSWGHPGGPQPAQRGTEAYRVGQGRGWAESQSWCLEEVRQGKDRWRGLVRAVGAREEWAALGGPLSREGAGASGAAGSGLGRAHTAEPSGAGAGQRPSHHLQKPLGAPPGATGHFLGTRQGGLGAGGQRREVGCLSSCGLQGDERGQSRCWTDRAGGVVHRRPPSPPARTRTFPLGPGSSGAGASNRLLAGSAPA